MANLCFVENTEDFVMSQTSCVNYWFCSCKQPSGIQVGYIADRNTDLVNTRKNKAVHVVGEGLSGATSGQKLCRGGA